MNSIHKQAHTMDFLANSAPGSYSGSSKGFNYQDTQSSVKFTTKFPPLAKNKIQDIVDAKQNLKNNIGLANLIRKTSEDTNIPSFKKLKSNKKKAIQKKKKIQITSETQEKYTFYKEFLNTINLSNSIQVTHQFQHKYVLYVGKGNNSSLIKNLFKTYRPWWTIEEFNSNSSEINLHWHQLRQNSILETMKEVKKTDQDFENCNLILIERFEQYQNGLSQKEKINEKSTDNQKNQTNFRSHSVTMKDRQFAKNTMANMKRSSSRIKSGSHDKIVSPLKYNIKKQIKQDEEAVEDKKKKKSLANPKMWAIYHNYRRLLNSQEMKQLKKLHALKQDGHLHAKISRNKIKYIQNKSHTIVCHNKLSNNWNLSNKKALFLNLKTYYQSRKENPFINIPMTFHIKQKGDKQFDIFLKEYIKRDQQIKEQEKYKKNITNNQIKYGFKPKRRNAWLVKPGENTNRGNGIVVVETLEQINHIIQKDTEGKKGQPRTHIIQQYIIPFLYQKRKFDIRTYILITSINGCMKGYWYQDGYIRTACKQFNMKNLANRFIHLTNDAVQKHHEDYGKFQPGNKLSYADFQRYLDLSNNVNENGQKLKFWNQAYPEMKKLATDSIRATYTQMEKNKKQFSFEIFGLDFLIDENFKCWLIEANTNPCLELSCPLLGRVIPGMLQNAFKVFVDPLFPPPDIEQIASYTKKLCLNDNIMQNNKFQLIFDEAEQGKELKQLLSEAPQVKIYDIEEEQQEFED